MKRRGFLARLVAAPLAAAAGALMGTPAPKPVEEVVDLGVQNFVGQNFTTNFCGCGEWVNVTFTCNTNGSAKTYCNGVRVYKS